MGASKRFWGMLLGVLFLMLLVGIGRSEGAERFVLKFASDSPGPKVNPYTAGMEAWMQEVEGRTDGRIQFQRFWSQSLVPSLEHPAAVASGVADVAHFQVSYWPGKFPLSGIGFLPGIVEDTWAGMKAFRDLAKAHEAVKKEIEGQNIKYVAGSGIPTYQILTVPKVRRLDDLKGLKLRVSGSGHEEVVRAWGGTAVFISITEVYDAMQRGILDGIVCQAVCIGVFKLQEAGKYFYDLGTGAGAWFLGMNMDKWKSLPPDLQKIIQETEEYSFEQAARKFRYEGVEKFRKQIQAAGVEFIQPTEADVLKFKELVRQNVWEKWIRENKAKGLPGQDVFNKFVRLYKQYEKESPFRGQFTPSRLPESVLRELNLAN